MKLYNTQTRRNEEIKGKKLRMYVCGPTVYDRAHIGNLRAYVNTDILKKTFIYLDFEVKHVMNITDIEDKIIKKSQETGKDYQEITRKFEKLFWEDVAKLNIDKPNISPHATDPEVIKKMTSIIETLLDKGFAYIAEDKSIYFSVSKFNEYGKLSHLKKDGIKVGARCTVDEYDKENPQDFALWKAAKEGEPAWDGPKNIKGRPGWHIECSAMSLMNLGPTIDIHAGGVDNIFPHHENEIAQSEAFTGKQFVKNWFHGEHLLVEGRKMSKSLGNLYTLDEMVKKFKVEPLALRVLCLQSHYRDKLNFTEKSINDAQKTLDNLRNFIARIAQNSGKSSTNKIDDYLKLAKTNFTTNLSSDLNTPEALATIFKLITKINRLGNISESDAKKILSFMKDIDTILDLGLEFGEFDNDTKKIFKEYIQAKESKNFTKSDEMRKKLDKLGWVTEDSKNGSKLRKK